MSKPWPFWTTHTSWLHLTARSSFTSVSRGMHCIVPSSALPWWNSAGVHPVGDVWVGNRALDSAQRGFVALGVPLGTPEFIAAFLETLLAKHRTLLDRLLLLSDTQAAWLLLSFCAASRAQYALRALPPADTRAYAAGHDAAILSCLDSLLHADTASGLPALAAACAQLALRNGGLGLRSAERHAVAAFWASWADALPALARRDRASAQALACSLDGPGPLPHALAALKDATASLQATGQAPTWDALLSAVPPVSREDDPADLTRGWQRPASRTVDELCDRAIQASARLAVRPSRRECLHHQTSFP